MSVYTCVWERERGRNKKRRKECVFTASGCQICFLLAVMVKQFDKHRQEQRPPGRRFAAGGGTQADPPGCVGKC